MDLGLAGSSYTGTRHTRQLFCPAISAEKRITGSHRPLKDELTLSILSRAKKNGYTALVVTADTMSVGWRPADIDASFNPFIHSVGCQLALSDPAFMQTLGLEPLTEADDPQFPYDARGLNELYAHGDAKTRKKG